MDLLPVPEYVIKKGRPHGHRYGKKPGHKEYYLANQSKKKCKKRQFLGIHDRFLQDQEFRTRMIENHRGEEVCRRWDAVADEDHTHHLTVQEYFHYKNKWWISLNNSGTDTQPLRKRSDSKQALSTLQRSQQEAGEEPHVPTYSYKHKQWELAQSSSSTWWNWPGGLLIIQKVKKDVSQVLSERCDPFLAAYGKNLRNCLSRIQSILLQLDRLQLTAVYCNRRVV